MKRKVVQQGPATLMISLPSKWVKENSITKGDELDVTEERGRLVLTLDSANTEPTKKEIDAQSELFNEYFVNYVYQKGYDEILIRYSDASVPTLVEKRAKQLLGFEIVEKTKNIILLKMLVNVDQQEFETVLKKLFQITLVMGDKISEALVQKNSALLEEVKIDEKENNKYSDLCVRILYKNRYKYPENGFALYSLLRELEQIGDHYKYIAESFSASPTQKTALQKLYSEIHAFFRLYYELYYSYDAEKAQRFFQRKNELLQESRQQLTAATKEEALVLSHFTALVQSIFNLKGVMFLQHI